MSLYPHFQEVKKAVSLPMSEQIGACLTCSYWDAPTPRPVGDIEQVAVCVQPQLKPFALIVSGSSACDKWHEKPEAGPEAKAYAERGEAK